MAVINRAAVGLALYLKGLGVSDTQIDSIVDYVYPPATDIVVTPAGAPVWSDYTGDYWRFVEKYGSRYRAYWARNIDGVIRPSDAALSGVWYIGAFDTRKDALNARAPRRRAGVLGQGYVQIDFPPLP
jgi:hypothetical protein